MGRNNRGRVHDKTAVDRARDDLFSAINRCGVLEASEGEQEAWIEETLDFLSKRHGGLNAEEIAHLRDVGMRFCKPVIAHGKDHTALTLEDANAA